MGGGTYYITMPKMVRVNLKGKLQPWVAAKDIILEVLRVMSVKGGVGKIVEYGGEGVKTLSVPERATITNMGAELALQHPYSRPMRSHANFSKLRGVRKTGLN